MITNIWKVFAILLEYCCRTDYRMLISEISKEHKVELEEGGVRLKLTVV